MKTVNGCDTSVDVVWKNLDLVGKWHRFILGRGSCKAAKKSLKGKEIKKRKEKKKFI